MIKMFDTLGNKYFVDHPQFHEVMVITSGNKAVEAFLDLLKSADGSITGWDVVAGGFSC